MRKFNFVILVFAALFLSLSHLSAQQDISVASMQAAGAGSKWVLVIHGGAGGGPKGSLTAEQEEAYLNKLNEALDKGSAILASGGSSLDAVTAAVTFMEDCPLFNAGKGAVLDAEGKAELDASVMDGRTLKAGAVGGVRTVKNPILAARAVMEKSNHVMLAGAGADQFAKAQGLEIVNPSYFIVPERLERWKKLKAAADAGHGTVGAVALDLSANLAAATSTGGMMNKMVGRLGDTPVIGAGTYANNATCAVSCTGHGEFFIRNVVAYDLSALMEYKGMPLNEAAGFIINEKLRSQKAEGGLIAIDREGNIVMPFNSNAMFRAWKISEGRSEVAIY